LTSLNLKNYSTNIRALALLFALIAICIFFNVITDGIFLSAKNITNLTRQSSIVGLLAISMVLVIVSGNIDLSVGSLTGLTGGLSAIIAFQLGWSLPVVILTTVVIGIVAGMLQGFVVAYLRVPAFIVTLGGMMIFRGMIKGATHGSTITVDSAYQYLGGGFLSENQGWIIAILVITAIFISSWRTHRSRQLHGLKQNPLWLKISTPVLYSLIIIGFIMVFNSNDVMFPASPAENDKSIPVPVLLWLFFALLLHLLSTKTTFGRRVFAIGGNAEAAYLSGINIKRNTLLVFVIVGFLSAIAGIVYTARVGSATAGAGINLELDAIAACVIGGTSLMGGRGSISGAIVGALIMSSLDNGMSIMNIEDFYQDVIKGLVLILAVYMDVVSKKK
jgi:D-xylose transport system permease protein